MHSYLKNRYILPRAFRSAHKDLYTFLYCAQATPPDPYRFRIEEVTIDGNWNLILFLSLYSSSLLAARIDELKI